jgi:glyoxylase-like metal-dependent hydrolase (beta-lactamase superfamily II)
LFLENGSLESGGQQIDYGYLLEAHTSSDIYVWFRDANVLAVGDVASPERDIAIDWYTGAWTGGRLDAMEALIDMIDDQTRIVPAYGPVMSRADFQAEHDMLWRLHDAMVVKVRSGYSYEDMAAEGVMDVADRAWQDPVGFLYAACKGLWGHQNALSPDIV